jgi:hypothetical protein
MAMIAVLTKCSGNISALRLCTQKLLFTQNKLQWQHWSNLQKASYSTDAKGEKTEDKTEPPPVVENKVERRRRPWFSILAITGCVAWYFLPSSYKEPLHDKWHEFSDSFRGHREFNLPPQHDPNLKDRPTLIIALELLINIKFDEYVGQWVVKKRPGVDYFLAIVSQYYELVLASETPGTVAVGQMEKLDTNHVVAWRMYRENLEEVDHEYRKNLSKLGRDISRVIVVDESKAKCSHPDLTIEIPKWEQGNPDSDLLHLSAALQEIGLICERRALTDISVVTKKFKLQDYPKDKGYIRSLMIAEAPKPKEQPASLAGGWFSRLQTKKPSL